MGFSLKSVGNLVGKAAGASLGAYLGGPTGAVAGYNGADAVLGAVGLGSDQLAAEQEFKYAKKAADYAFGKNLEMWNLANAYNDPAAQMERLQKAGLNPNLVYGGGNVTGNSSASIPSYDTPNVNYTDRSTQRQQLAMALIDHQQRITNQSIENDLARQRLVLQERDADRADALAKAQIDAYAANLGLTSERIGDIRFNQDNYTPPDRRGWIAKAANDLKGLYDFAEDWAYNHTTPGSRVHSWASAYKNSWFHKYFGAGR